MSAHAETEPTPLPDGFLGHLEAIVGPAGLVTDPADMDPYLEEQRGLFHGQTPCVVRPGSTEEVSKVLAACYEAGVAIVPQGGNTGLCGGAVASGEIIVSLSRMNTVRAVDPVNFTMTVDAGCVLADLQRVADDHDRLFPLSLGAEGSCQIGGNLSTNAGGTAVLRYGNTRELTLGLEVVLPDGRIWDGLTGLRKNNTGYDLKHLFIGAEGSLGIITGAVVKLFPKPVSRHTAFVALNDLDSVLDVLGRARAASADTVSGFELIPRIAIEISVQHIEGAVDFLAEPHDWYALIEFESSDRNSGLGDAMESFLEAAFEDGLVVDAVIAQSESQRDQMWFLREAMVLAQKPAGASIKNDVSVPISSVPDFIRQANAAVTKACPGIRPVAFGHVGDGNVHYNLTQPEGADGAEFLARWDEICHIVHDVVDSMRGSFSAEHGIGKIKVAELAAHKAGVELDMMRSIKTMLDPKGLMNPGKVLA
jgi:FAD/FMN-containing dehydrogenase